MKTIFKKLLRAGIAALVYSVYVIIRMLPYAVASRLGALVGTIVYYLNFTARRLSRANLAAAFPEKNNAELMRIARAAFANQGRNFFEFCTFGSLDRATIDRYVTLDSPEVLKKAFDRTKGILYLSAHFGNWEFMGASLSLWGYPINV
ncbi:MAG: hypothetical protein GF384_00920, partial [Elusimicrobia bacterium]|nr:hypothetical protein [Elusimicrobiota bacterium]MBD3411615.1 hypothetical protein [Elusimicrobiota bacterium]